MTAMVFEKATVSNNLATGTLIWGTSRYAARSGGHGKGPLPDGGYTVKTRQVVDRNLAAGFRTANAQFFIPIHPNFSTTRSGFGIHPDGNQPGTLGCIGLADAEAKKFWTVWMKTALSARPTSLTVRTQQAKRYAIESKVKDATVKQALREALQGDGRISYDEVRAIIRSTFDGRVSRQELSDLQSILANSKSLDLRSRRLIDQFIRDPKSVKL